MTPDHPVLALLSDTLAVTSGPAAPEDIAKLLGHAMAAEGYVLVHEGDGLMGSAEACAALGTRSSNLRQLAGLPAPLAQLKSGPVWTADAIEGYAASRRAQED